MEPAVTGGIQLAPFVLRKPGVLNAVQGDARLGSGLRIRNGKGEELRVVGGGLFRVHVVF